MMLLPKIDKIIDIIVVAPAMQEEIDVGEEVTKDQKITTMTAEVIVVAEAEVEVGVEDI